MTRNVSILAYQPLHFVTEVDAEAACAGASRSLRIANALTDLPLGQRGGQK